MSFFQRLFLGGHTKIYRWTGGRVGGRIMGLPILLLHHKGRKSGKPYVIPLSYLQEGEAYVVTASAGGATRHPGWYYNLQGQSETTIEVGAKTLAVTAKEATGEERQRLWQALNEIAPAYGEMQQKISREFPMLVLRPK